MKPAKATVDTIMTILGPYLSAAQPLIYMLGLWAGVGGKTYNETDDPTCRSTVTETRLPRSGDGVTDSVRGSGNTESSKESS
jgi:hypothetical protein